MASYDESDLRTEGNDVALIQRTFGPSMNAQNLIGQLVRDLTLVRSVPFVVDCIDEWWLISSARDWLEEGSISLRSFKHIVHFPEAGREACHSEILLTAFAKAVVTRGSDRELVWITGDEFQRRLPENIERQLLQNDTGRSIAFLAGLG